MIALAPREFHQFHAAGRHFLYLVPSAAIFELNQVAITAGMTAAVVAISPQNSVNYYRECAD